MAFLSAGGLFGLLLPIVLAVLAVHLIQIAVSGAPLGSSPALVFAIALVRPSASIALVLVKQAFMVVGIKRQFAHIVLFADLAAPNLSTLGFASRLGIARISSVKIPLMISQLQVSTFFSLFTLRALIDTSTMFGASGFRLNANQLIKDVLALRLISGRSAFRQAGDRDREQQRRNHEYAKKFLHVRCSSQYILLVHIAIAADCYSKILHGLGEYNDK